MQEKEWNEHYRNNLFLNWWPNEAVVAKFSNLFKSNSNKNGLGNILDFGCGNGRHCRFLLEQSERFQVPISLFAIDLSHESISITDKLIRKLFPKSKVNLKSYDGKIIPYDSNFFDIVFSVAVLDQLKIEDSKTICDEIYRITKPGGTFLVDLECLAKKSFVSEIGSEMEENTYVITSDCEKGIFQHYFTENELKELFSKWSYWRILEKYTSSIYDSGKLTRHNERSLIILGK